MLRCITLVVSNELYKEWEEAVVNETIDIIANSEFNSWQPGVVWFSYFFYFSLKSYFMWYVAKS